MVLVTSPLMLSAAALVALTPASAPTDTAVTRSFVAVTAVQEDAQPSGDSSDDTAESSTAEEATGGESVTARADQASADNPQVLMRGDAGTLVAWWQDRINDWFALSGRDDQTIAVDGIYGPNTETATRTFQDTDDTVETDGIVNPIDRVALRDAIDALQESDATEGNTLERGATGTSVAWWQDRINDWFALSGRDDQTIAVDGIYGPNTETATRTFQDTVDTVETDGTVDPIDRVALRDAIDALETDGTGDNGATDRTLTRGDAGTLVAWWQDRINDWFALSGRDDQTIAVDGIYGPNTETATRTFQDTDDTVETDGTVDPIDRVALRDAIDALETGAG